MTPSLKQYIDAEILPRYDHFDPAHRRDHVDMVITESLKLAKTYHFPDEYHQDDAQQQDPTNHQYDALLQDMMNHQNKAYHLDEDMVYTIAAYHDTGLVESRETHHTASKRILLADKNLRQWFSEDQLQIMGDAVEDHRASSKTEPRTIYGKILAEADRTIDPTTIIRRTIQFGLSHYPTLDKEGQYGRTLLHLQEKYAEGGYFHLLIPHSQNALRLQQLRTIIATPATLRHEFDRLYSEEHPTC